MVNLDLDNFEELSEEELKANMLAEGIAQLDLVKVLIDSGKLEAAVDNLLLAKSYIDGSAHARGAAIRAYKR